MHGRLYNVVWRSVFLSSLPLVMLRSSSGPEINMNLLDTIENVSYHVKERVGPISSISQFEITAPQVLPGLGGGRPKMHSYKSRLQQWWEAPHCSL